MTRNEIIQLRRQMRRRIRAVVAERRIARLGDPVKDDIADRGPGAVDPRSNHSECSLIGG